jgi:tryptophanyl-tRNA synthetase
MRILSGIQPTGELHIGNYLGALKQWIDLQHDHECFYMLADLHALTVPQNPKTFRKQVVEKATEYIAVGLDPETCVIFAQSQVPEHTELTWIFNTLTPMSELERMTQFKDKSIKQRGNINAGLFDYPVLMAADILIYLPDAVPVGHDQVQHIELTRLIAKKFNSTYGKTFPEPKVLLPKQGARIMSLKNPKNKMSKSDGSDSYISLFEHPESIQKKIMSATTDAGKHIAYNTTTKPGISNLLTIYSLFNEQSIQSVEKQFAGKGYAEFKASLAELLIEKLEPFRTKKQALLTRQAYVEEILTKGADRAQSRAAATMRDVRQKLGLL